MWSDFVESKNSRLYFHSPISGNNKYSIFHMDTDTNPNNANGNKCGIIAFLIHPVRFHRASRRTPHGLEKLLEARWKSLP